MPSLRAAILRLCATAFCLSFVGASCGPSALTLMPGVINDPKNLSLRRSLLAYGMGQVCDEVRSRSMALRLGDDEPVAGRFFPTLCKSREQPSGEIYVELAGHGYVWTDKSLRIGFEASAAVAYDVDFLLDGSTTYVYFRVKGSSPPKLVARLVEEKQVSMFARIFGAANGGSPIDSFGGQVMAAQLQRGFTVIRDASGGTEVGLGVVAPGQRPPGGGFVGLDRTNTILANERIELHQNQRDFTGPFVVPPGKQLGVMVSETGAPAVDLLVIPRGAGDAWLAAYTHERDVTPPPAMPVVDDVVAAGPVYRRALRVPPGSYYVVLDNTANAGRTSLPTAPRDDKPVVVSYAVQLE